MVRAGLLFEGVADESTFLQLLAANPGDRDAWLVYADWLEGQGDVQRARLLRLRRELVEVAYDDPSFVKKSRALLACSRALDNEWLAAVSHPRLEHTCWGTRDHEGVPYLVGFLPAGMLQYRRNQERVRGNWGQVGNAVRFDIFDYSDHVGAFVGERMRGTARNKNEGTWNWELVRIDSRYLHGDFPELGAEPMDTDYKPGNSRD